MSPGERPASPLARSALALCVVAIALGIVFWRSLGSLVAEGVLDIFIAFVRFFAAIIQLFPGT